MQRIASIITAVALAILSSATTAATAPGGFVTRKGARLVLDGRDYRAIGVNVPHLSQAYIGTWFHIDQIYGTPEKAKQAMIDALDDAQKSGVAFIRFFANPGYPRDTAELYARAPATYWRRMDHLFAECRKRHLKLVPSLETLHGWYLYCGERAQAILDPKSKTYAATRRYIREFVKRYRHDPTVLMWELENEAMLAADVDMKGRELPPKGIYPPGTVVRETSARDDSLTWDMTLRLYREQTAFIKSLDRNHLVTSGDASVRPECTSRRETFPDFKYGSDTLQEWLANNVASQPPPLDVYSFHVYGSFSPPSPDNWGLTRLALFRKQAEAVRAAGRPLFVGELGQTDPSFKQDPEAKWTRACIDEIERDGVSLAAIWVWHFPWQPDLTVSGAANPALVRRIAEFNRKHGSIQ